jgi:hypothetical protein
MGLRGHKLQQIERNVFGAASRVDSFSHPNIPLIPDPMLTARRAAKQIYDATYWQPRRF